MLLKGLVIRLDQTNDYSATADAAARLKSSVKRRVTGASGTDSLSK
jgi:hypothetical protein